MHVICGGRVELPDELKAPASPKAATMEVTYVDVSACPPKIAGELSSSLRIVSAIYGLAICVPGLIIAVMIIVDDSMLRSRGTQIAAPLQVRLLVAFASCLPTVLALIFLGWRYRSRRSTAAAFGKTASSIRRDLRRLKWRLDRMAGYPRARRLAAGRSLLLLAPAIAFGTLIYAAATKPQQFPQFRTNVLMAGVFIAIATGFMGMRILRPRRREASAMIHSWALRLGGLALFAGTALAALIVYGNVTRLWDGPGSGAIAVFVYVVGSLLSLLAFEKFGKLRARASAVSHPATRDVRRSDRRRPVLLLRSFADDALSVAHEMESRWEDQIVISLEDAVARQADRYGPLIAVAEPGIGVTGGAARDRFLGEEWRTAVQGWMDEALLVTMVAGWTEGVQWELTQAVERGHVAKLLIILPEGPRLGARWRHVCRSFSGTRWHAPLISADVRSALAVYFGRDGKVYVIASRAKSAGHYEAAVETAIFGLLCRD
jgi:hypothetical protein